MPQNKWMNFTSVFNKVSVKKKKKREMKNQVFHAEVYMYGTMFIITLKIKTWFMFLYR